MPTIMLRTRFIDRCGKRILLFTRRALKAFDDPDATKDWRVEQ